MTIYDVEKNQKILYKMLLQNGYKLSEIDDMDIHYYLELLDCSDEIKVPKQLDYIDNVI